MGERGIKVARWGELPGRLRGLRLLWGSEMMWHHPGELGAVAAGILEGVFYTSEVQREALGPGYAQAAGISRDWRGRGGGWWGTMWSRRGFLGGTGAGGGGFRGRW